MPALFSAPFFFILDTVVCDFLFLFVETSLAGAKKHNTLLCAQQRDKNELGVIKYVEATTLQRRNTIWGPTNASILKQKVATLD